MKKAFIFLFTFVLLSPHTLAASLQTSFISLDQDRSEFMQPVTLQATEDNEITEFGIELFLLEEVRILWHDEDQTLTATGSAVEAGRLSSQPQVTYLTGVEGYRDYKIVHIAVDEPFLAGEEVEINGLALRSYNRDFIPRDLRVNLDEDRSTFEATAPNAYRVSDDSNQDRLLPYPPLDVTYEVTGESSPNVLLTWILPPDYDLLTIEGERRVTRDGKTLLKEDIFEGLETSYLDENVQWGDEIVYTLFSWDEVQFSEFITINVTVSESSDEEMNPSESDSFFGLLKSLAPQKTCQISLFDHCFLWESLFDLYLIH